MSARARDWRTFARSAWAGALGVSILALTAVLFDEDLGTGAPLFGEWTCLGNGKLELTVTNGFDEAYVVAPEMALKIHVGKHGAPVDAFMFVFWREDGDEWSLYFSQEIRAYPHFQVVAPTTNATEIYVAVEDISGEYCRAESGVLRSKPA